MNDIEIDRHDLTLLQALQRDGLATNAVLGGITHLSASQVSRRVQRLVEAQVITRYAAILDPHAVGLSVTAYAQVILERHDKTRPADFEREVALIPEVLECFAVTGEVDYVLRIVAPDLGVFSELMMKRLLTLPGVAQVKTNIAIASVKETRELPLDHIARPRQPHRRVRFVG